jgi:hypothetical protein
MYYGNGNKYDGDWLDDQRTGKGVFNWKNGDKFDGEFLNGQRNGNGICFFNKTNTKYIGDWSNDRKNGKGICKYIIMKFCISRLKFLLNKKR